MDALSITVIPTPSLSVSPYFKYVTRRYMVVLTNRSECKIKEMNYSH